MRVQWSKAFGRLKVSLTRLNAVVLGINTRCEAGLYTETCLNFAFKFIYLHVHRQMCVSSEFYSSGISDDLLYCSLAALAVYSTLEYEQEIQMVL